MGVLARPFTPRTQPGGLEAAKRATGSLQCALALTGGNSRINCPAHNRESRTPLRGGFPVETRAGTGACLLSHISARV